MTEKIQELLAVLGIKQERKQEEAVAELLYKQGYDKFIFADYRAEGDGIDAHYFLQSPMEWIAFRLRDEVVKLYPQGWRSAKYEVGNKVWGNYHDYTWDEEARPIHWIVAFLISKELNK